MFGLDTQHIVAYAMMGIGGIGLLTHYGGLVFSGTSSVLSNIKSWFGSSSSKAVDDDTADFQALARINDRFERLQCPEGIAACQVCMSHFFHHPAVPPATP